MRIEILKAIEAAKVIEEEKKKLVVGTGKVRVPKDEEGNAIGAPIMINFDAGKGLVFFRVSDEEGDPWAFEFLLPVAEALGLALNDLLGLFDGEESDKIRELEANYSAANAAANYFAEEKEIVEKKLENANREVEEQRRAIKSLKSALELSERMLNEPGFKNFISKRLEDLEHFADTVSGLFATDRPDLVDHSLLEDNILFKIEPPKKPEAEEVSK